MALADTPVAKDPHSTFFGYMGVAAALVFASTPYPSNLA